MTRSMSYQSQPQREGDLGTPLWETLWKGVDCYVAIGYLAMDYWAIDSQVI